MPPQKTKKQIDALEGRQRPLDKVLFSHSESALYASLFSDLFKYVTMRTFTDSSFFLFRVSTFDLWFSVFFFPGCFQFHRFRRSESVYSVLHKHAHINTCIHRRPIEQCFFFFLSFLFNARFDGSVLAFPSLFFSALLVGVVLHTDQRK